MNEGDIVIVFSQYGEVVDCRLARDQKTGKPKGFAFLAYEDQRSTILAVDNLNGIELCGRTILVDHVRQFKIPREYLETDEEKKKRKEREKAKKLKEDGVNPQDSGKEGDEEEVVWNSDSDDSDNPEFEGMTPEEIEEVKWQKRLYKPTGPDGKGWGDFRKLNPIDLEILQEYQKAEDKEAKRRMKVEALKEMNQEVGKLELQKAETVIVADADSRWE